jgi:hypothetical protein
MMRYRLDRGEISSKEKKQLCCLCGVILECKLEEKEQREHPLFIQRRHTKNGEVEKIMRLVIIV